MRVLVFGATGLLGQAFVAESKQRGHAVVGAARRHADHFVDISQNAGIAPLIIDSEADLVVNAAAVTDLDACERQPDLAYQINAKAVQEMARACEQSGARLLQISSDHYFTGHGEMLHDEMAPVTLVNEYARTKFAGEEFSLVSPNALAVRTNVTGLRGWPEPTFFEWAVSALKDRAPLTLFDDYFTSTINAPALAHALLDLMEKKVSGLLNVAAREVSSKKCFIEVLANVSGVRLDWASVGSVKKLAVPRAESLGLDVRRAEALLGYRLPDLQAVVASLVASARNADAL